jgi:histidine triad (HIT) family protein
MTEATMSADCIFCKIIAGQIPSKKVYEDDHVFAFEDLHPAAPTHVLVIPKKHIAKNHDIGEADAETMGRLFVGAKAVAETLGLAESGYRMVMNNGEGVGQSVFHIHLHVLGGRGFSWPPG